MNQNTSDIPSENGVLRNEYVLFIFLLIDNYSLIYLMCYLQSNFYEIM